MQQLGFDAYRDARAGALSGGTRQKLNLTPALPHRPGLMDTFLQNPLGNPLANKPILQWFPSFGPMQYAVGGAFAYTTLRHHLLLGLVWAAAFAGLGLLVFWLKTCGSSTADRPHC